MSHGLGAAPWWAYVGPVGGAAYGISLATGSEAGRRHARDLAFLRTLPRDVHQKTIWAELADKVNSAFGEFSSMFKAEEAAAGPPPAPGERLSFSWSKPAAGETAAKKPTRSSFDWSLRGMLSGLGDAVPEDLSDAEWLGGIRRQNRRELGLEGPVDGGMGGMDGGMGDLLYMNPTPGGVPSVQQDLMAYYGAGAQQGAGWNPSTHVGTVPAVPLGVGPSQPVLMPQYGQLVSGMGEVVGGGGYASTLPDGLNVQRAIAASPPAARAQGEIAASALSSALKAAADQDRARYNSSLTAATNAINMLGRAGAGGLILQQRLIGVRTQVAALSQKHFARAPEQQARYAVGKKAAEDAHVRYREYGETNTWLSDRLNSMAELFGVPEFFSTEMLWKAIKWGAVIGGGYLVIKHGPAWIGAVRRKNPLRKISRQVTEKFAMAPAKKRRTKRKAAKKKARKATRRRNPDEEQDDEE